jgi:hypothetical protein
MFRYSIKKENGKTYKYISAIFLKINILNTRNKIGRIDDLALRIYDANQSPENSYMFFATKIYDKTFSLEAISKGNGSIFSAISVLNKSDYSTVLELNPEEGSYPEIQSCNVVIDLIYLSTKKEWCSIGTYNLHSFFKEEIKDQDVLIYTSTHSWSLKRNIQTTQTDISNNLYNKLHYKHFPFNKMEITNYIKRITNIFNKTVKTIYNITMIAVLHIFYNFIILPILSIKQKWLKHIMQKITLQQEKQKNTDEQFQAIFYELEKIIHKINLQSNSKQKIDITKNSKQEFTINYLSQELKFYHKNNYIKVFNQNKQTLFTIELMRPFLTIKLCKLNNKLMTTKTCCIKVIEVIYVGE